MSTILLRFTRDGLQDHSYLTADEFNSVPGKIRISTDGSREGYAALHEWAKTIGAQITDKARIVLMRTPLYAMRMVSTDGNISSPHFLFSEENRVKWLCAKIAAPQLEIYLSDVTDEGGTKAKQTRERTELICYLAYRLWSLLLIAEERLCFPAAALDRLTRHTFQLTKQTINIDKLRADSGIPSLDYEPSTEMLSITIGGELFTVKLSVLNALYGELILPRFNRVYGRRLQISVSVIGQGGVSTDPIDMSYGELGRIIEDMRSYVKEQRTSAEHPIDPTDLMLLSRKDRLSSENSLQVDPDVNLQNVIAHRRSWFIPAERAANPDSAETTELVSADLSHVQ